MCICNLLKKLKSIKKEDPIVRAKNTKNVINTVVNNTNQILNESELEFLTQSSLEIFKAHPYNFNLAASKLIESSRDRLNKRQAGTIYSYLDCGEVLQFDDERSGSLDSPYLVKTSHSRAGILGETVLLYELYGAEGEDWIFILKSVMPHNGRKLRQYKIVLNGNEDDILVLFFDVTDYSPAIKVD